VKILVYHLVLHWSLFGVYSPQWRKSLQRRAATRVR
jgi:hypothetical protein